MTQNQYSTLATETVGLIFGRFNPPHKGHSAAWSLASKETHWYVGTNRSTQGPKDPLPFCVKVKCMEAVYPEITKHIVASQSWLTLASELYTKHPKAGLVLFTDEAWVSKTVQRYNGVKGPHGFYRFKEIKTKTTPRLSSATALRQAVLDNDTKRFQEAAGVPADTLIDVNGAHSDFFNTVRQYLEPYKEKNSCKKLLDAL